MKRQMGISINSWLLTVYQSKSPEIFKDDTTEENRKGKGGPPDGQVQSLE